MTHEELLTLPNAVPFDAAKIKEEPEFRVLLYPPEGIPRNDADTFNQADITSA